MINAFTFYIIEVVSRIRIIYPLIQQFNPLIVYLFIIYPRWLVKIVSQETPKAILHIKIKYCGFILAYHKVFINACGLYW